MRRIKRMGLAIVATLALSVVGATSAWATATASPHWQSGSKTRVCIPAAFTLYPSKTACLNREMGNANLGWEVVWGLFEANSGTGKELTHPAQKFLNATESVECSTAKGSGGFFNVEETTEMQGKTTELVRYSGCKVFTGEFKEEEPACKVTSINGGKANESDVIVMENEAELVFLGSNKEQAEKNESKIGALIRPYDAASEFVTLDFTGICTHSGETELKGAMIAEVEPEGVEEEWIYLKFPTTALSSCWKWTLAGLTKCETPSQKLFGVTDVESGEAGVRLESKEKFGAFQ